jgi:hypothetical protein
VKEVNGSKSRFVLDKQIYSDLSSLWQRGMAGDEWYRKVNYSMNNGTEYVPGEGTPKVTAREFTAQYEEGAARIRGFVRGKARSKELAEDIAARTWLKAWTQRQFEGRNGSRFFTWVSRLAPGSAPRELAVPGSAEER